MNQKQKILEILKAAGEYGCQGPGELSKVAWNYKGRIHELRRQGYWIDSRPIKDKSYCRYILISEPEETRIKFPNGSIWQLNESNNTDKIRGI